MDCGGGKFAFFQPQGAAALSKRAVTSLPPRLETGLSNRARTAPALVRPLRWISGMVDPGFAAGGRHGSIFLRRRKLVLGGGQRPQTRPDLRRSVRRARRGG